MPQELRADVVVAGGGAAGLMAAIEAHDRGAETVLIESEAELGGSSAKSGGYVTLCDTPMVEGGREELLHDLHHAHGDDDQPELSRIYVAEAGRTYERLQEHGVRFAGTMQFAHMSRAWAHEPEGRDGRGGGAEIVWNLVQAARSRNIPIYTGVRARSLLRGKDGAVTGLLCETGDGEMRIEAGCVVLATGGFTRNPDLIAKYGFPGSEKIVPITGVGSRGDGLRMALEAGAQTAYIEVGVAPSGPVEPTTEKGCLACYAGAVILNRDGKRFFPESALYNDICRATLKQPGAVMFQVYDQEMRDAYAGTMLGKVLAGYREEVADTLDALMDRLAALHGLDAEEAKATLRRYNAGVLSGEDEMGRTHNVGTSGECRQLATPPFYGVRAVPGTTHFNGGVKVDDGLRIVGADGAPIPGLLAAGEIMGGFHGRGYMSGSFIGMALTFGRLAGARAGKVSVQNSSPEIAP